MLFIKCQICTNTEIWQSSWATISLFFPFLALTLWGAECWDILWKAWTSSQLDPSRIRLNGNCQVNLLSILLSYCEAATLLHRACFIPAAAHQIPPTVTYSVSLGFANASCPSHLDDLRAWWARNPLTTRPLQFYSSFLCSGKKNIALLHWIHLHNCWGRTSNASHWR